MLEFSGKPCLAVARAASWVPVRLRTESQVSCQTTRCANSPSGGVLSLPFAMSQCGLVLGTFCLLLSAVASAWTLSMLVDCARATGRDSFELVGHAAYGEVSQKECISTT
eukprot:s1547_g4.t1